MSLPDAAAGTSEVAADLPCGDSPAAALLAEAEAALDEPSRAERQATAAFALLSRLDGDHAGHHVALLLRAAAAILRGRRRAGRLRAADEAFQMALPFLAAAPPVSGGRATLLAALAQLRWSERRLDEAAALFVEAARIFAAAGERQGEAACRAQGGFVLVEQRDPGPARAELAGAGVDAELAPALAARVGLVLAWCHLAVGRTEEVREHLAAARRLYGRAPEPGEEIFRAWWEARILFLEGESDQADARLDAVRRRLLAMGSFVEAARSSFDLLLQRVQSGRFDALSSLGPDLLNAFDCRPWAFGTVAILDWLAILAAQRSPRYPQALAPLHHHLAGLAHHPQDRPSLIPDVRDLADRLLLAARRRLDAASVEEAPTAEPVP